jgi:replication factor A1
MRHKPSIGEYLAFLSIKYEVNPEKFLYALRAAQGHKSNCGNLSIQCRGKIKTKLIFLIKRGSEVIAQFRMDREFLLNKSNQLKNFMETDRIRRYLSKKNRTSPVYSIRDVRAGMSHVNLKAKILEVAEPKRVVTRYGNNASVAKVLIGDETGTIKLCLWNGQIEAVSVGDIIQIENAQASVFRGERFLSLGKKGTLNNEVLKPQLKAMELPAAKT